MKEMTEKEFWSLQPEGVKPVMLPGGLPDDRPSVEVTQESGSITISYTFPGFFLFREDRKTDNGQQLEFQQINITRLGHLTEGGKPLLPLFGRYVQIPHNMAYEIKSIKPCQKVPPFKDIRVLPAQQELKEAPAKGEELEFKSEFYNTPDQNLLYPDEIVQIVGPFDIDEYRALLIRVCPFQYNPFNMQLIGYGNIEVTIGLQADPQSPEVRGTPISKEAFGNLFLNPQRAIERRLGVESKKILLQPAGVEYRIIYAEIFKDAAAKLVAWKNRRGLSTDMVSIDTIGNETGKIKEFLRTERERGDSRLRYVSLLGDVNTIAPERIGNMVTDYYYSTQKDPTDKAQLVLPWLSIGRIPVESEEEALSVVNQIIAYEKDDPPKDRPYFRRMVFAASFEEYTPADEPGYGVDDRAYLKTIEEIRNFVVNLNLGFDARRVYVKNDDEYSPRYYRDGTPIPDEVKRSFVERSEATGMLRDAARKGQLIIAHRDHASDKGWENPPFTIQDLNDDERDMPSIYFSINCSSGDFDCRNVCFAEKLLRRGTAPSLIAATSGTDTWLSNDLIRALFDALFGGLLPTFPNTMASSSLPTASYPMKFGRLGDLLNYAKAYLPTVATDVERIKELLEATHVLGDPTLEIWKDVPREVDLKAVITADILDVQLSECPQGTTITVWHGKKMVRRLEPSSTHFALSLRGIVTPLTPLAQPVDVCFWASGYRYKEIAAVLR